MTGRARCRAFAPGSSEECGPGWPAALPGPLCGGETGTTGRAAGIGMDADAFSPAHGCAVEKPGPGSRTCRPRMGGKRQAGWPSLLVTFLLATQEKSDSVAEGDRPLLALQAKASRTRCAPTGVGDRPLFAMNAAKSIARERAPTGWSPERETGSEPTAVAADVQAARRPAPAAPR